jgi:hypothetical protein
LTRDRHSRSVAFQGISATQHKRSKEQTTLSLF